MVIVRSATDHRVDGEVVRMGRRGGQPLKARRAPWIAGSLRSLEPRVDQVEDHDGKTGAQDHRTDGAETMQRAEALEVIPVATGHALRAEHELREERDVEADEHEQPG